VAGIALLAILLELLLGDREIPRVTFWVVAMVFGTSCMCLHFIARGRERLQVIAELRSSLLASNDPTDPYQLSNEEYDEITRIERGEIDADRRRSIRSASGRVLQQTYGSKEHRAVREAKLALPPEVLVRVQASIDSLVREPRAVRATTRDGVSYLRVPDTPLEVGFSVDSKAREIKVLSLLPVSQRDRSPAEGEGR
jgi:hypothetical protein